MHELLIPEERTVTLQYDGFVPADDFEVFSPRSNINPVDFE